MGATSHMRIQLLVSKGYLDTPPVRMIGKTKSLGCSFKDAVAIKSTTFLLILPSTS